MGKTKATDGNDVEKLELSHVSSEVVNNATLLDNRFSVPEKLPVFSSVFCC